jgi:hypothetical protein
MAREIKHADELSEALVLTLEDGRKAIIKHEDVRKIQLASRER